ncbi:putative heterokaryon incompatibility [Septoria linicola]|nr:putative heterokaryon incompatibility [Septoria linicola]
MQGNTVDQLALIAEENSSLYQQLPSTTAIRLVQLAPGSEGEIIRCRLLVIDKLEEAPSYEALSYWWGSIQNPQEVQCGTRAFTVSDNLFHVLARMRHQEKERVLWIDAMCINQHDLLECGSQVSTMRHIYTGAHRVLVWLGTAEMTDYSPLETMKGVTRSFCEDDAMSERACLDMLRKISPLNRERMLSKWDAAHTSIADTDESRWR